MIRFNHNHYTMDQKIDQFTLARLVLVLDNDITSMKLIETNDRITVNDNNLTTLFQDLTLNQIYDIILKNSNDFRIYNTIYDESLVKTSALSVIENAEVKNRVDALSKEVTEIKDDIKSLNEKMAVLIDALTTLR